MRQFENILFVAFVRIVATAARNKRLITYQEIQELCGLSRKQVGIYAGELGKFCVAVDWPVLNSIIVDKNTCKPKDDCPVRLSKNTIEKEMMNCFMYFAGTPLTGVNDMVMEWWQKG